MIDEFFSTNFDKPQNLPNGMNLEIHHPVIRRIYEEYGVTSSNDGFYRIVDPETWQASYLPWFFHMRDEEGVFEGKELYPFMTTAFGFGFIFANLPDEDLVGYVDITNNFNIVGPAEYVFNKVLTDPITYKYTFHGELYEEFGPTEPPLTPDECFGFFPLLSMGGEPSIESIQRVKMREHLGLLAQAAGLPTQ